MTIYFGPSRLQWHYDNQGYYAYILLNSSKAEWEEVQGLLKQNQLCVLLAGPSHRPASNGRQYDWYIRISDKDGKHPSFSIVKQILTDYETARYQEFHRKSEEFQNLRTSLDEKQRQLDRTIEQLELSRKQYQKLEKIYQRTQKTLEEYQRKSADLEKQLLQIQESSLKQEEIEQIHSTYKQRIRELEQELEQKQQELKEYVETFDPELQKKQQRIEELERQIVDLQNKNASLENEKDTLIDQYRSQQEERQSTDNLGEKDPRYFFQAMLSVFLPQIEFLRGTTEILWQEIQDPLDVFRNLRHPDQYFQDMKIIQKLKDKEGMRWREKHIEGDWRLYMRRKHDSVYQVFIGHKKTQKTDVDWLGRQ